MIVYHYTSEEGVHGIVDSNIFYPSYLDAQLDTAFGEGWYFTDLPPSTPNEHLEQKLWMRRAPEKTKRYIAFEIDDNLLEYCRDGVYRLKIESVNDGIIKLNLTYTYNSNGGFAFRYLRWGYKDYVAKSSGTNWGGILGTVLIGVLAGAVIGAAAGAISKS